MKAPTRTQEILLQCCCLPSTASSRRLRTLLEDFEDWDRLVREAEELHRLSPMLLHHLQMSCPDLAPEPILERLRNLQRTSTTRNLHHVSLLQKVCGKLEEQGVPCLTYKGPVLAQVLYGNLGLRQSIDVDLIVAETDFHDLEAWLRSLQLEPLHTSSPEDGGVQSSLHFFDASTGAQLDVHWQLFRPYYGASFDFDSLWRRREVVEIGGRPLATLHAQDSLIVVGSHGTKHLWALFKWLCDFRLACDSCSPGAWEAVLARSRELRVERLFLPGLAVLQQLLGVTLSRPARQALAASPASVAAGRRMIRHLLARRLDRKSRAVTTALLKFRLIPSRRHRLSYLADGIWRRLLG